MGWENGVLFVKSAQGHSGQMTALVDATQAIPVIGPGERKVWPRTAHHGTSVMNVWSIAKNGVDNSLAWGGRGTGRAHYHCVAT
eukprot:8450326-Alexandrium_andersonii.AAC.1